MLKKTYFLIFFIVIVLSLPKAILALTGDFDGSGIVDGKDLMKFARSFGSKPGDINWNPVVDIDNNSKVDGNDLISFAANFGKSTTPPAKVSGLALNPGNNKIDLQWTNPSDSDFKGVLILRKAGSAVTAIPVSGSAYIVGNNIGDGAIVYNSSGTAAVPVSWTDNGVSNGNQYYYSVFTYDDIYNYSGGEQDFGVPSSAVPDITSPPSVTVTATNAGTGGTVNLDWSSYNETSVGDVDLYKVYQSTSLFTDASGFTPVKIVSAGTMTGTVTGLTNGAVYYFAVTAVDKSSNENKGVSSVSVVPTDTTPPSDITGVTASNKASSEGTVTVSWSANTAGDLAGYKVYYSTGAITNVTTAILAGQATGGTTTYTVTGLTDGTTYTFAVTAIDKSGNEDTAPSSTATAAPLDGLAPGALSTVTAASKAGAEGTVTVSWNPSTASDAAGYKVYYSTSVFTNVTGATLAGTAGPATTSYNINGLTDGTTYYFGVTAVDEFPNENKAISANPSATPADAAAPSAVSGFYASSGNGQVALNWSNPSNMDFAGVKVVRKTGGYPAAVTDGTLVYTGIGTSRTDTGLNNNTTYYYAAFSYDEVPNYSAPSPGAQDSATPSAILDPTSPPAVPLLASNATTGGTVNLSWSSYDETIPGDVKLYKVYQSALTFTDVSALSPVKIVPVGTKSTTITGLTNGTSYYFAVTAVDTSSNENPAVTSVLVTPTDTTPPSDITGVTAVNKVSSEGTVTVSWSASTESDLNGYKVYYSTGAITNVTTATLAGQATGGTTTFTVTGLTDGTTYTFAVTAIDKSGNEDAAPTSTATATPLDGLAPGALSTVIASSKAGSEATVTVSWNPSTASDAAGYRVYYSTSAFTDASGATLAGTAGPATTSYNVSGLTDGTAYYFGVTAVDEVPNENKTIAIASNPKAIPADAAAPGAVSGFYASPGNGLVALSWTNPTNADFAGVKVVRKTGGYPGSHTDGTQVYNGTGTGYTDTTVVNDTTYYYAAFSYDEVLNYSAQSPSAQDSATPYTGASGDTTPPGLPTGVTAAYNSLTKTTTVTWTDQTGAESPAETYSVYRHTAVIDGSNIASAVRIAIGVVKGTQTFGYTVPADTDGLFYYAATSSDSLGNESAPVSIATAVDEDNKPPVSVKNLTATAGNAQAALTWVNPTADYVGTLIIRKTTGYPTSPTDGTLIFTDTTNAGSYADTPLSNGTKYYYAAFAYDDVATPNYSSLGPGALDSATPSAAAMTSPSNLAVSTGSSSFNATWNAVGGASGYIVYYDNDAAGPPYGNAVNVGAATSFALQGIPSLATYYFTVTAYVTGPPYNESPFASEVSATTTDQPVIRITGMDTGVTVKINGTSYAAGGSFTAANGTTLTIETTFNGHTYTDVIEAHYDLDIYLHAVDYGATHPVYVTTSSLGYSDYDIFIIESTDTSLLEVDIDHWDAAKIIGLHIISPNVYVGRYQYADPSYIYGTLENNGNMTLGMGYYAHDYINRLSANVVTLDFYSGSSSYEYKIQELIAGKVTINDRQVSIFNLSISGNNLYSYDFDRNYLNANLPDIADDMVWFKAKNPSVYALKPGINITSSGGKSVQFGDGYYGDRVFWETKLNEDLYWYNNYWINDAYFLGPYTEMNRLDWYYDDDYNDFHFEGYSFGTTWNTLLSNPTTGYGYASDGAKVYSPVNVMKIKSGVFYTDDISNNAGARFYNNPGQDVLFLSDTNTLDFQCQDGCSFYNNTGSHWVVEDDLNYLNYTPDSALIDITTAAVVRDGAAGTVSVTANNTYSNSTMYVAYRLKSAVSTQFTKVNMTYSGTEWTWSGALSAGSYYFYVVAVQNDGYFGKVKEFDIVMEGNAPTVPASVVAEPRNGGAHISWNASGDGTGAGIAGYKVHYGPSNGGPYGTTVDVGNQLFSDITLLANGTPYYFVVSAYDYNGNESGNSTQVSTIPESLVPAAPTGLSVANPGPGRTLRLTWTNNAESDLGGYYVKYGATSGIYTNTLDAGNILTMDISGLADGTAYYFVISAYDIARNESPNSSPEMSGTPTDNTPPANATNVQVAANGYSGELILSWTSPTDADYNYVNLYRSISSSVLGDLVTAVSSSQRYKDTALSNGTTYYYTFRPVDATGNESIDTAQYSGVPADALAPKAPTGQANAFSVNEKVNDDAGTYSQQNPDIAVDKNGNVYMVWEDDRDSGYRYIYFAKSTDGGKTFGSNVRVDDNYYNSKYYPAISLDAAGNIYVAWRDSRNGSYDIYFAKSTNGGTSFSANVRVTDDISNNSNQYYPDIAIDSTGKIHVVWYDNRDDSDGGYSDIYYAISTNGGATFGTNIRVNDGSTGYKYYPSIGVDSADNVYVAWEDQRNGYSDIYVAGSSDGGATFGTNVKANSTTTNYCYRPSMALYRNDGIHLTWYDNRNGNNNIFYAKSVNGASSFGANVQVNDGSGNHKYYPDIAVDASGAIHVVWQDYRNSVYDVYYASSTNGGTSFGTNVLVDDSGSQAYYPTTASDASGNIYTTWYDSRNGNYDIYSSRMNRAPTVTDAFNGKIDVTWIANTEADIAGYKIHYGTTPGTYSTTIDAGNVTTYQLTGMTWNQTYYIAVSAYDTTGNDSIKSLEASGMTTDGDVPTAPAGFSALDVASDQGGKIALSWNKSADEGAGFNDVTEYRVYRSTTSGSYTGSIATVPANASATYTYTDSTADKLTQYYFIVRAYDGTNESTNSTEAGPAKGTDNLPPAAPTGILSWVQASGSSFESGSMNGVVWKSGAGGLRLGTVKEDFISVGNDSGRVYYARSKGDGTFDNVGYVTIGDNHRGGAVADFDNDGDYDIAAANDDDGYAYIIKQTSPGVFASPVQVGSYVDLSGYEMAMAAGDFNEDGKMDFLLAGNNDDIYLYLGDGAGNFTTTTVTTDAPNYNSRGMDSGDINKDGHLDFIYSESNGYIYAYYGNGNGTFQSPVQLFYGYSDEYAVSLADFNGDGNLDIIEGGYYYDDLDLYLGDGNGNFTYSKQVIYSYGEYHNIDNYDFDSDGDQDLIVTNVYGYNAKFYRNDGSGNFTEVSTPVSTNSYTYGVAAPDDKRVTSGTLVSSIYDTGGSFSSGTLYFDGDASKPGTAIKFQIRSAADEAGLASATWYGPTGTGDFYTASASLVNAVHDGSRWIQYKLILEGDTWLGRSPVVGRVTITYGASQAAPYAFDTAIDQGGSIDISWKLSTDDGAGSNDVTGYEIHRSNNPGFAPDSTTLIAGVSSGTWGYTDTAVPVDKKPYYYIVRASDGENNGDSLVTGATVFSSDPTGKAIDNIAPAAPTSVAIVDTPGDNGGSINIYWTLSTDDGAGVNDVSYYDIHRSLTSGFIPGTGNKVGSVATGTSLYTDTTATLGQSFYYIVRARDGHPNYSSYSETGPVASSDNVANPPQSLAASDTASDNGGSITLTWDKSPDEGGSLNITGYRLYRGTTTGFTPGTSNLIASLTASGAASYTVTDTGATTGTTLYYIARSTTAFYESANSNEASATSVNNLIPAQVINPKASNGTIAGNILVTWAANTESDLSGYKLYYDNDASGAPYTNVVTLSNVTEKALTGLASGSTYYFAISAVDSAGNEGALSSETSLLIAADSGTPAAPTGVSASDYPSDQGKSITVTWTKSADDGAGANDVAAYDIYRGTVSGFTPGAGNKVGTVAAGVNSYADSSPQSLAPPSNTTVDPAVTNDYYYIVRARDGAGNYTDSAVTGTAANAIDNTAPGVPAGVKRWVQTSQADFSAGTISDLSGSVKPGSLKLAESPNKYIVAGYECGSNYIYLSNGDGTFTYKQDISLGCYQRGYGVADFDNDGDYDIVAGDGGSSMYIINQTSPGVFASPVAVGSAITLSSYTMDMAAADFNNDGNYDFIVGGNNRNIYLFTGDGAGGFTTTTVTTTAPGSSGRGKDAGDINEDGNMDFVYAEYSGGEVYAYYGNGDGTFASPVLLFDTKGSSNDPYGVTLADFTGDGHLDIISNGGGDGQYDLWEGDGSGGFTWKWTVFDLDNHGAIDNIDFDGDGDQDLVVTRYSSYDVRAYKNNGDGTFTYVSQIGTPYSLGIGAPSHDLYKASGSWVSTTYHKGTEVLDRIYWSGSFPTGTTIKFQIRTAAAETGLDTAQWYGPISSTDYYETSGAAINTMLHPASHEWIQYRAVFETTNLKYTPQLDAVEITYGLNPTVTAYDLAGDDYNRVVVEWSASGDDGKGVDDVTRYDVYRGTTGGFTPDNVTNRVAQVTATGSAGYNYTDTVPALGADYYYKVRAFDATIYSSDATSNVVQAMADGVAPPSNVTVSDVASDQGYKLKVDWSLSVHDGIDVTGYDVLRSETSGGTYSIVGSVAAGVSTYTDTAPYNNIRQGGWALASNETFDGGATGWTKGGTAYSTVTNYGDYGNALGGYNQTAGGSGSELSKSYDLSASPHTKVRIVAEYLALDSWDGEQVYMKADGTNVFSQNNSYGSHPVNVSNTGGYNDEKIIIDTTIDHTGNSLALLFGSTLDQGATDESFAVADVKVYVYRATESADYFYIVRAKDGSGHTSDSNEASGVAHDNIAPAAPTGILNATHTSKADFEKGTLTKLKARSSGKVTFFNSNAYISIGTENGSIYYARSVGDGTFANVGSVSLSGSHRGGAVDDFDNDGDYDIIAANSNDGYAYLIKQTSPGVFATPAQVGSYVNLSSYEMAMAAGDFNEDGNMDFLLAGNNDDIYLYLGDGAGNFTTTTVTTDAPYYYARGMDSGDINKDGHLDFIYGESNGYIYAYYGNGDGSFQSPVQLLYGYSDEYAVSLADFNGDGNLDIIEGGYYYDDLDLYLGDGNGNFTYSRQAINTYYEYHNIDNLDFDNDGDQDLIVTNYYGYNSKFYRNDGNGNFTYVSTPVATNYYTMAAATPSLYDSSKTGAFVSSAFDLGSGNNPISIGWKAEIPAGASVKFQIRSAATEAGLSSAAWYGPTGTGDYYTVSGAAVNSIHNGQRWMQYKSFFERTTIEEMPALDAVTVTFGLPQAAPFVYDTFGDNGGSITINWMPSTDDGAGVNDVVGYDLHRSTSSGFTPDGTSLIASVSAGTYSYVDNTAVDGTDYYYIVQAKDQENKTSSAQAGPVQSVNDGPPAKVTGLAATPHDGYIDLSWTNPTVDFAGVMVRRSATTYPATITDGVEVYNGPANSVSDTNSGANNLQFGTTYYYTVFSYDGIPNYSAGAMTSSVPVDKTAPSWTTTTGVQSATPGNGSVLLSWGATGDLNATTSSNSAPVKFKVYVSTASPATSGTVTADIASSPYTVTGLSNGTTYFFTVRAIDNAGNEETNPVELTASPYVSFTDMTAAAGLGDTGSGRGAAVADIDKDGDLDIFAANYGSANRLFINNAGTYTDNASTAGVAGTTENSVGALFADFNSDGWPDLYVTNDLSVNQLYINNKNGTFTLSNQAAGTGVLSRGATAGDIDNDGDIDIYVANYGSANYLFINNGDGTFTESAVASGVEGGLADNSTMAVMFDINRDGKLDILVVNEGQADRLYEQQAVSMTFTEKAATYGLADAGNGHGAALGDVDNDGDMDIYVTRNGANLLYINNSGIFTDDASARGVADASNSYGAVFADIDHDGDLDLYVANDGANKLYLNDGTGVFTENASNAGLADTGISYGVVTLDDGDGDPDIYVLNNGANTYYRNEQNDANYLKVNALDKVTGLGSIGARVEIYDVGSIGTPSSLKGIREIIAGSGYASSGPIVAHFGLVAGNYGVRVIFPSGTVVDRASVATGQTIQIMEPGTIYWNNFDSAVTGIGALTNSSHFHFGAWGATGNGYWCGEGGAYATANGWPGGAGYGNNWDENLTLSGIDLRGLTGASIEFIMRHDMEASYEFGYIEVSTNGGTTWTAIQTVTGVSQTWTQQNVNLSSYVGNVISLRFRFISDSSWSDQDGGYDSSTNGFDGAFYLDNLVVSGN